MDLGTAILAATMATVSVACGQRLVRLWSVPSVDDDVSGSPPLLAVALILGWTAFGIARQFVMQAEESPQPSTAANVWLMAAFSAGFWLTLLGLLPVSDIRRLLPRDWPIAVRNGFDAFAASLLPTWLMLALTSPLRRSDVEHSLLLLWQAEPTVMVIIGIVLAAVVLAPLLEELQFRVILQSWLVQRLGPFAGVALVVALFALLHGWRDGLALIPLAAILGWTYHRTRSYLTVVTAHALFNALNLALAAASTWSGQ